MPGSVQNAAPTTVLPQSLCRAFSHSAGLPADRERVQGRGPRSGRCWPPTSRKKWTIRKRLTPTQLAGAPELLRREERHARAVLLLRSVQMSPKFSYDPTGVAVTGRYIVRFNTDWRSSRAWQVGRAISN